MQLQIYSDSIIYRHLNLCLFTLLNFVSTIAFSQEANKYNIRLKFHPLALAAVSRPTVLGSIEFKLHKIGIDLAYGQQWGFILSSNPDTQRVKNFGNQYRIDIKYYFKQIKEIEHTFPFISIGYCKMYTQRNITRDWFSGYVFNPSLAFIDNVHIYYLNFGICNYYKRSIIEGVIGSGVRFRTQEAVYADKIVYDKISRVWPHLSFSLRVGYLLTNKPKK
jgi:hypothetical protein